MVEQKILKLMRDSQMLHNRFELDAFGSLTEEEIILLWRSYRSRGLSANESWHAIFTGIALDVAFARARSLRDVEQ